MHRLRLNRKDLLPGVAITIAGVVVLVAGVYFYWRPSASITFQEYTPTWLPPDTITTAMYLSHWVRKAPQTSPTELDIDINHYGSIRELKNDGAIQPHFTNKCSIPNGSDTTCTMLKSQKGQQYRLTINKMSSGEYETVEWLQGETLINVDFNGSVAGGRSYSPQVLSQFIDSFAPITYKKLDVKMYNQASPSNQ